MSANPVGTSPTPEQIKEAVRKTYAASVGAPAGAGCCGAAAESATRPDLIDLAHYTPEQLAALPADAVQHAYGCGNPLSFAGVQAGQVVLDIGSGAGIDVLLAARIVGPAGKVIGIDMTPEMIERARRNAEQAGARNVEFRLGDAEAMPVEDASVDWIISNCVINLAPDKKKVFVEAIRVLKPGGRLSVSDILTGPLPPDLKTDLTLWSNCVSGAREEDDYLGQMRQAGFVDVAVTARQHYDESSVRSFVESNLSERLDQEQLRAALDRWGDLTEKIWSAKITARKP